MNDQPTSGTREKLSLSCHQCKSRKNFNSLVYCTSHMNLSACKKKYCVNCLKKFYEIEVPQHEKPSWVCPACNRFCKCALCKRKSKDRSQDPLPPQSHQHLQPHQHQTHQHLHHHHHHQQGMLPIHLDVHGNPIPTDNHPLYPPNPGYDTYPGLITHFGTHENQNQNQNQNQNPNPNQGGQFGDIGTNQQFFPLIDPHGNGLNQDLDSIHNNSNLNPPPSHLPSNIHLHHIPHQNILSTYSTFDTRSLNSAPSSPTITVSTIPGHQITKPIDLNKPNHPAQRRLIALDVTSPAFSATTHGLNNFPHILGSYSPKSLPTNAQPQSPQQQWQYDSYYLTLFPKKKSELMHLGPQITSNELTPNAAQSNDHIVSDQTSQSQLLHHQHQLSISIGTISTSNIPTASLTPNTSTHPITSTLSSSNRSGIKRKHPLSPHSVSHDSMHGSGANTDSPTISASFSPKFGPHSLSGHQNGHIDHIRSLRELREMGLGPQNLVQLPPPDPLLQFNTIQRVSSTTGTSQHSIGSNHHTPNHASNSIQPLTPAGLFFTSSLLAPSPNFSVNQPLPQSQASNAMLPPSAHHQQRDQLNHHSSHHPQFGSTFPSSSHSSRSLYDFQSLLKSYSTATYILASLLTSLDEPNSISNTNNNANTTTLNTTTSNAPTMIDDSTSLPITSTSPSDTIQSIPIASTSTSTTTTSTSTLVPSLSSPTAANAILSTFQKVPVDPKFILEYLKSMLIHEQKNFIQRETIVNQHQESTQSTLLHQELELGTSASLFSTTATPTTITTAPTTSSTPTTTSTTEDPTSLKSIRPTSSDTSNFPTNSIPTTLSSRPQSSTMNAINIASRPLSSSHDKKMPRQSLVLRSISELLSIPNNVEHAIQFFSQQPFNLFDSLQKLADWVSIELLGEEHHRTLIHKKSHRSSLDSTHSTHDLIVPSTSTPQQSNTADSSFSPPVSSFTTSTPTTAPTPTPTSTYLTTMNRSTSSPHCTNTNSSHTPFVTLSPQEILFNMKDTNLTFNFYKCFISFFTPTTIADVIRHLYQYSQLRQFHASNQLQHQPHQPHQPHQSPPQQLQLSLFNQRAFHPSPILLSNHQQIIPPQLSDFHIAGHPISFLPRANQPSNSLPLLESQNPHALAHHHNSTQLPLPLSRSSQLMSTSIAAISANSASTSTSRTNSGNVNRISFGNHALYTNPSPVLVPLTANANPIPLTALNTAQNINSLLRASVSSVNFKPINNTSDPPTQFLQTVSSVPMPPLSDLTTLTPALDEDMDDHQATPKALLTSAPVSNPPSNTPGQSNNPPLVPNPPPTDPALALPASSTANVANPNDAINNSTLFQDWLQLSPQTIPAVPVPQLPPLSADALKLNQ